jgi:hypothetical protein
MDRAVGLTPALEPETERRAAPRIASAALLAGNPLASTPIGCRITPGRDVRVLNISAVGLLVESRVPLSPGRTAAVHLTRGETRLALNGRIVRSSLSTIDRERGATFVSAIAFDHRVDAIADLVATVAAALEAEMASAQDERV